jgi:hypothetical protein
VPTTQYKIAVCLSGQIRTGTHNFLSIKNYIGSLWDSCDFFIHTWDSETYTTPAYISPKLKKNNIPPHTPLKIDGNLVSDMHSLYKPVSLVVDKMESVKLNFDFREFSIRESIKLMTDYNYKYAKSYDFVLRLRPDLYFSPDSSLLDDIKLITDSRTFGYALLENRETTKYHIHSEYFLSSVYVMEEIAKLDNILANSHKDKLGDTLVHMGEWIIHGLRFNTVHLNAKTTILRYYHLKYGAGPRTSWNDILKIKDEVQFNKNSSIYFERWS